MDEGDLGGDDIRCAESTPLSSTQETIVIIAHYASFVTSYLVFYCIYAKQDILKQRIYSTLLLFTCVIFLSICPGFEIGEHYFTEPDPWELKKAPSNLINGSFAFFNVGGVCLTALAIRKIGLPFFRIPSFENVLAGVLDLVVILADIVIAATIVVQPLLYATRGRLGAQELTTPINAASGILILVRLWKNLGPNRYTLIGGIGYLVFTLSGVFNLSRYKAECDEFIHFYIGGSFALSLVFLSLAIWYAEPPSNNGNEGIVNENTPLNRV